MRLGTKLQCVWCGLVVGITMFAVKGQIHRLSRRRKNKIIPDHQCGGNDHISYIAPSNGHSEGGTQAETSFPEKAQRMSVDKL